MSFLYHKCSTIKYTQSAKNLQDCQTLRWLRGKRHAIKSRRPRGAAAQGSLLCLFRKVSSSSAYFVIFFLTRAVLNDAANITSILQYHWLTAVADEDMHHLTDWPMGTIAQLAAQKKLLASQGHWTFWMRGVRAILQLLLKGRSGETKMISPTGEHAGESHEI